MEAGKSEVDVYIWAIPIAALIVPGIIMYFVEQLIDYSWPPWAIPTGISVIGIIILMTSIEGAGDLGAVLFAMFVCFPAAFSVLLGSKMGGSTKHRAPNK